LKGGRKSLRGRRRSRTKLTEGGKEGRRENSMMRFIIRVVTGVAGGWEENLI